MILVKLTQFFFIIFLINSLSTYGSAKSPHQQCGTPHSPLAFIYNYDNNTRTSKNDPNLSRVKQESNQSTSARYPTQIPSRRQQNN